jgi:L-fucose mutarotase/ribose pyranase (RbsD/FucU family)
MDRNELINDILAAVGGDIFAELYRRFKNMGHSDEDAKTDAENYIMAQFHIWMALGRPKSLPMDVNKACMERAIEIASTHTPEEMSRDQFYDEIRKIYRKVMTTTSDLN